jgi:uncharacterized membrane protein YqaE (UPF0057 family)
VSSNYPPELWACGLDLWFVVNVYDQGLVKGGLGGFFAHRVRGSSPTVEGILQVGIGKHFWINILLTILGYIPGIVHAVWVIAKY